MTNQEIFDKVARHLLAQGAKSMGPNGPRDCRYRDARGRSCAVGCLIPDELYHPGLETKSAISTELVQVLECAGVVDSGPARTADERFVTRRLLESLQVIHDGTDAPIWSQKLALLAEQRGLNRDVLKEFQHEAT